MLRTKQEGVERLPFLNLSCWTSLAALVRENFSSASAEDGMSGLCLIVFNAREILIRRLDLELRRS